MCKFSAMTFTVFMLHFPKKKKKPCLSIFLTFAQIRMGILFLFLLLKIDLFHNIYSNYRFPSTNACQAIPTFLPLKSKCFLSLSLKNKQESYDNNKSKSK